MTDLLFIRHHCYRSAHVPHYRDCFSSQMTSFVARILSHLVVVYEKIWLQLGDFSLHILRAISYAISGAVVTIPAEPKLEIFVH